MYLMILMPLLGFALAIRRVSRRSIEPSIFVAMATMIVLVYLGGLVGLLESTAKMVFLGGLMLLIHSLYLSIRSDDPWQELFTPGVMVFVLACIVYAVHFRGARYHAWDEFSHWGLATKSLLQNHHFADGSGYITFLHYPPGTAVWHYMVCRLSSYSDANVYLAHFMLLTAPLLLLFQGVKWRQWGWLPGIVAIVAFLVLGLGHGIVCLYVDHVLGSWILGGVLLVLYRNTGPSSGRSNPWIDLAFLCPTLGCVGLIKPIGLLLGLPLGIYLILGLRKEHKWHLPLHRKTYIFALIVACCSSLLCGGSWQARTSLLGASTALGDFTERENVNAPSRFDVGEHFAEVFFELPVSKHPRVAHIAEFLYPMKDLYQRPMGNISAFGWFVATMTILILYSAAARAHEIARRTHAAAAFLFITFAAYVLLLFAFYRFVLEPKKAVWLASYVRYIDIMLLPMVGAGLAVFLPGMGPQTRTHRAAFVSLVTLLYLFQTPYLGALYRVPEPGPIPGPLVSQWAAMERGTR